MMGGTSIYEDYQLYHFDISYQFANLYYGLIRNFVENPAQKLMMFYVMGVIKMQYLGPPTYGYEYIETNYYFPIVSLIVIILLALIVLILGTYRFNKRDISL